MAQYARDGFIATSAQTTFTISFSFEQNTDVHLSSQGVELTQASGSGNFTISGTTATLGTGATTGDVIWIWRATSQTSRTVTYNSPPAPSDSDLNADSLQAFYMAQEALDAAGARASGLAFALVQQVRDLNTAVTTGGTALPIDDTIPQDGEGAEFFTVAITPDDLSNPVLIEMTFTGACAGTGDLAFALFSDQDGTANAMAVVAHTVVAANDVFTVTLRHYLAANATVSATTFSIRAGNAAGDTVTMNGSAGARLFGGLSESLFTVTELRQTP